MAESAHDIARELLPGFLHFISDKKWNYQLDELLFADIYLHIATEGDVPEKNWEEVSHDVLDRLQNLTKALCPQAFN